MRTYQGTCVCTMFGGRLDVDDMSSDFPSGRPRRAALEAFQLGAEKRCVMASKAS